VAFHTIFHSKRLSPELGTISLQAHLAVQKGEKKPLSGKQKEVFMTLIQESLPITQKNFSKILKSSTPLSIGIEGEVSKPNPSEIKR